MKRLILSGEIGCGKTTLIRTALGSLASVAGGFVTFRILENEQLLGFDLAPASSLVCPESLQTARRFLDFSGTAQRNDAVFAETGAALLKKALSAPFAVADEFGGLELLVPAFRTALFALLQSDTPCIGVMKTPAAAAALAERIPLGCEYAAQYQALKRLLETDPETCLLPVTPWPDSHAAARIEQWVNTYVRR